MNEVKSEQCYDGHDVIGDSGEQQRSQCSQGSLFRFSDLQGGSSHHQPLREPTALQKHHPPRQGDVTGVAKWLHMTLCELAARRTDSCSVRLTQADGKAQPLILHALLDGSRLRPTPARRAE